MPGITGIVSNHANAGLESSIDRLILPMKRRPWFQVESKILPGAALASISLEDRCPVAGNGEIYLAACGLITGEPGLESPTSPEARPENREDPLSRGLFSRYLRLGIKGLCGLNGQYAVAIWEDRLKKLTLVNDRYGLQRIYTWQAPNGFLFASEIKALSGFPGFPQTIDEAALSDLLYADHILDDRTLFENIKALPGASILTYQDGRLVIQQYWDYRFGPPGDRPPDEEELLAGLAYYIDQSVTRRVRRDTGFRDTCLLLTGGLDSRILAGMLHRCAGQARVVANTIGLASSRDVTRARQIARVVGLEHTTLPPDPGYLAAYAGECILRAEGNMNVHASWIFAEDAFFRANRIRRVMTGLFGEAISGRNWAPLLARELSPTEAWAQYQFRYRKNAGLLAEVLRPEVYARVIGDSARPDSTFASIRRTLAHAGSRHPLNQFDYFHLHQKLRRHSGAADVFGDYCQALDPFTDNDLVDFALSIPPALRQRGRLYKKMIVRHLPEVAEIGYERTGASLRESVAHEQDWILRVVTRSRKLVWRNNSPHGLKSLRIGDPPDSSIRYNEWLRADSRPFVLEVLARAEFLDDYFNRAAVERLVRAHMEGKRDEFRIIGAILTFSLWRQHFCQGVT
jgi:asparagine synthase (glutamine-hydrolysing)